MSGEWLREPEADVAVVFIHGIFSSAATAWTSANGCNWPDLVAKEPELTSVGIYTFSYQTDSFSGGYSISDAADDFYERLKLDRVCDCNHIVLVCHSMGGIVVRKMLIDRSMELHDSGITIHLLLVASPSLGSDYASWLVPLARFFGHKQAEALAFVRTNAWLTDLDKAFLTLRDRGRPIIKGRELVEDKSVTKGRLWRRQIVEPFSAGRYFGEPLKIAATDHFTIAKPDGPKALQHRILAEILRQLTIGPNAPPLAPVAANPEPTPGCVIGMPSLVRVDDMSISLALNDPETNWQSVRVDWPEAANQLVEIMQDALRRFDTEGASLVGSDTFISQVPGAIRQAQHFMAEMPRRLPTLVHRLQGFDPDYQIDAIRNFLLFGCRRGFASLAYYATWDGLAALGHVRPKIFDWYRPDENLVLARLCGYDFELNSGRVTRIGDHQIGPHYAYVWAPAHILNRSYLDVPDKDYISRWFVPQLEVEAIARPETRLPASYAGTWHFPVVKTADGHEI